MLTYINEGAKLNIMKIEDIIDILNVSEPAEPLSSGSGYKISLSTALELSNIFMQLDDNPDFEPDADIQIVDEHHADFIFHSLSGNISVELKGDWDKKTYNVYITEDAL